MLNALRNPVDMVSVVFFVRMRNFIVGQHAIQHFNVGGYTLILRPRIKRQCVQLLNSGNVLIQGCQRCVGSPFGRNHRLRLAPLHR